MREAVGTKSDDVPLLDRDGMDHRRGGVGQERQ